MNINQLIKAAQQNESLIGTLKSLKHTNDLTNGKVEVDENYLDMEYKLVHRPRYRLKITNHRDISDETFNKIVNSQDSCIFLRDDIRYNTVTCDYSYIKNPYLSHLLSDVADLYKSGVYSRLEITDWNEESTEAWDVMAISDEDGESQYLEFDVQDEADSLLFNYHIIAIIESNKDGIKVTTDEKKLEKLTGTKRSECPKSTHIMTITMQSGEDIPNNVKDDIVILEEELHNNNATLTIEDKKIIIKYNGLYLDIGAIIFGMEIKHKEHANKILKLFQFIYENMDIKSEFKNPFTSIELKCSNQEFRRDTETTIEYITK